MHFVEIPGILTQLLVTMRRWRRAELYRSLGSKSVNYLGLSSERISKWKNVGLREGAVKDEFCVDSSALPWFQMPAFLVLFETEDVSGRSHGKVCVSGCLRGLEN